MFQKGYLLKAGGIIKLNQLTNIASEMSFLRCGFVSVSFIWRMRFGKFMFSNIRFIAVTGQNGVIRHDGLMPVR